MNKIVLATINATYAQTSLGLRYLLANMGPLQEHTILKEFTVATKVQEIAEKILAEHPQIVGLSAYIWNIEHTMALANLLKMIAPKVVLIGGGPEFQEDIESSFDYILCGEADFEFSRLCQTLIDGGAPASRFILCEEPALGKIKFPYKYYSAHDIKTRKILVESSRGCPFECQFCLSSLDKKVRRFDTTSFLSEMDELWKRGARKFKFIDRTFNLNMSEVVPILEFFEARSTEELFLHFEIVPDHLNERIFSLIERFPKGVIQFEVGIQSFNKEVSWRIGRKQDYQKVIQNVCRLVEMGTIHLHTDLIVGLPGESIESFGVGFNKLLSLRPHEIQVGILKKLPGAPIAKHDDAFQMLYRKEAPYEIISSSLVSFDEIQKMRRFARYWDLYYNSGNFLGAMDLFLSVEDSFNTFYDFSNWLYMQLDKTHQISLEKLARLLIEFLPDLRDKVCSDYMSVSGRTLPRFLRDSSLQKAESINSHKRQRRHLS